MTVDIQFPMEETVPANSSCLPALTLPDHDYIDIQREEIVVTCNSSVSSASTVTDHYSAEFDFQSEETVPTNISGLPIPTVTNQDPCTRELSPLKRYINNDHAIKYYTSFDDYRHFKFFLYILGPSANELSYQCSKLVVEEHLFLTLMKLRQGKDDFELSTMFSISESTVRRIFMIWLNFLYYQLKDLKIWPSSQAIQDTMPRNFKEKFPTTRVILDATEIPIQKPNNLILQSATFSSYKNQNTVKTIIGCTPCGLVSYISDTYGGRTTDRQIIERSDLLLTPGMLCHGDSIMADRGIMVQDLFVSKGVLINTPHLLNSRSQLDPGEVIFDRRVASKRIHVERVIGLAKTFKILKRHIDSSKIAEAHKLVFVCFSINNFRNTIVDFA